MWSRYRDDGVVVWAIASDDANVATIEAFRDAFGLDLPILVDPGGLVLDQYQQEMAFPTAVYPQEWMIGTDGRIAYLHNEMNVDALIAVIERELAGE